METGATIAAAVGVTAAVLAPDPGWGASATGDDTHLLALCERFHAHHAEAEATTTDAALTAAQDCAWAVQKDIQAIRAVTLAGQAAKAHVALRVLDQVHGPALPGDGLDFALATLAEVAGVPHRATDPSTVPVIAAPLGSPDAALLAACASADAVQRRQDALYTGATRVTDDNERDTLLAPLYDEQEPFLEQVCELRATTLAGHMARAHTLALWDKEALRPADGGWNSHIAAALVRDLVGED